MLTSMTRAPETPTRFTVAELRLIRSRLDAWLQKIQRAEAYVEETGELWVFKAPTLQRGLTAMSSFVDSVESSLDCAAAGSPVDAETTKSRMKATADVLGESIAAEVKQKYGVKKRGNKKQ